MKKNLTYILILALAFTAASAFAQNGITLPTAGDGEVNDQGDVPNNDPINEWFYDGRDGTQFNSQTSLSPDQLVPIGSQNAAAPTTGSTNPQLSVAGLSQWFMRLLGYAVQLILALALISFLYGVFRLVFLDASNEEARNKARKFMLWGICALFVMVSVWGLVNVLRSSFFGSGAGLTPPGFK